MFKAFITERIKNIILRTASFPISCICAPAGFGKSTLIKYYVQNSDSKVIYISLQNKEIHEFYELLCDAVFPQDSEKAEYYRHKEFKTASLRCRFVREISLSADDRETIIIIDNFHLIDSIKVKRLILDLTDQISSKIRFIVASNQACFVGNDIEVLTGKVYKINCFDLSLLPEEIKGFYQFNGLNPGDKYVKKLYNETGGYIAPSAFKLSEMIKRNDFDASSITCELIEPIFKELSDEGKKLLYYVSLYSSFSTKQAEFLLNKTSCNAEINEIYKKTGLIANDGDITRYKIHNALKTFCKRKRSQLLPSYISDIYNKNGLLQISEKNYQIALSFLRKAKNYKKITEIFETGEMIGIDKNLIIEIFNEIPKKIKEEYPMAMLWFAASFICHKLINLLENALELFRIGVIKGNYNSNKKEKMLSFAELLLASNCHHNFFEMKTHLRNAIELSLNNIFHDFKFMPVTFGTPTMTELFYSTGKLSDTIDLIFEVEGTWNAATGGCRKGWGNCSYAELMYMSGKIEKAEIFIYRAINDAKKYSTNDILLSALFQDGRIAITKGDISRLKDSIAQIKSIAFKNPSLLKTADMCLGFLYLKIGRVNDIADWLLSGKIENSGNYPYAMPAAYAIYMESLIVRKKNTQLLAIHNEARDSAIRLKNRIALIYIDVCAAAAHEALGIHDKAERLLSDAFIMANEGGIIMPFVEYNVRIEKTIYNLSWDKETSVLINHAISTYKKAANIIEERWNRSSNMPLTNRELEIAELAIMGLHNREMAEELFVSENTIKSALKSIYLKLDIYSRRSLKSKLNEYK